MVLQRIILVQLENPGSMWFYKESCTNTELDPESRVYVVLQRESYEPHTSTSIENPGSMWFYKESY